MNKLVPTLVLSLIASIFIMWYLAIKSPAPGRHIADNILVVGTNTDYQPFSFMEDETIKGFDIDLINEVGNRLGKKIELRDMPFDALIHALQTGSIQVIAGGLTPTPERAQRVIFTQPYLSGDQLFLVSPAHMPIKSLEQLKNNATSTLAVNEGYTADYYVSHYYKTDLNAPQITRFATPMESFMALNSGRVNALVAAQNTIKPFIEHYGARNFTLAPIPDTTDEYALAISKKYPDLLIPIQQALDEITRDGTLEQLKKKWKLD